MAQVKTRVRDLLDRGEVEKAAQLLRRTLAHEDRANPRYLNLLGICESRLGNNEVARGIFSSVLSEFPRNAAALTNLGNVAFLDGDQESARDYYVRALRENVLLREPRYNLVRSYQYMGHFEKALRAYEEYVAIASANRWSKTALLVLLFLLAIFLIVKK